MFLGLWTLGSTMTINLQAKNGNAPVTVDSGTSSCKVYLGTSSTAVATVTVTSTVTDSQTGYHKHSVALTVANGLAAGIYTMRWAYQVSSVAKVQEYAIQVV